MSATLASPQPPPALRVSQGAASVIVQIAGSARTTPEGVNELALSMLDTWQQLDAECLHPRASSEPIGTPSR